MATRTRRCCRSTALVASLLATTALAQMPTFSLKAVRVNPECVGGTNAGDLCTKDEDCDSLDCSGVIPATNRINANPGDVIVAEIYASNWSPNGYEELMSYLAAIDVAGFHSGSAGTILPLGLDKTCLPCPCQSNDHCPDGYECHDDGCCYGPDHNPEIGAFLDESRTDYVFEAQHFSMVDTLRYRFAGYQPVSIEWPYIPPPKYCGTLILSVSNDAAGTFTIPFVPEDTSLYDFYRSPILPLELEALVVVCHGEFCELQGWYPSNCAIDARQPSDPDGSNRAGWDSIEITFAGCDTSKLGSEDFSVRAFPWCDPGPCMVRVIPNGNKATLLLPGVPLGGWICVIYVATGEEVCLAHLPGDVNNDGTSAPTDILYLIDCLNGLTLCEIWQCNVDRSAVCGPPDILRVIDLLNGAGAYDSWLNRNLPECPSAP